MADPRIAIRFLDEVAYAIDRINQYPLASLLIDESHRRKIVHGFPYSIFYSVSSGSIRIVALAHQSRESDYWVGRT